MSEGEQKNLFGSTAYLGAEKRITYQDFKNRIFNSAWMQNERYKKVGLFIVFDQLRSYLQGPTIRATEEAFMMEVFKRFQEHRCAVVFNSSKDRPVTTQTGTHGSLLHRVLWVDIDQQNLIRQPVIPVASMEPFALLTSFGPNFSTAEKVLIDQAWEEQRKIKRWASGTENYKFLFAGNLNLILVLWRSWIEFESLLMQKKIKGAFRPDHDMNSGITKRIPLGSELLVDDQPIPRFLIARSKNGLRDALKAIEKKDGLKTRLNGALNDDRIREKLNRMIKAWIELPLVDENDEDMVTNFYARQDPLLAEWGQLQSRDQMVIDPIEDFKVEEMGGAQNDDDPIESVDSKQLDVDAGKIFLSRTELYVIIYYFVLTEIEEKMVNRSNLHSRLPENSGTDLH
jgi:hypothetical protein